MQQKVNNFFFLIKNTYNKRHLKYLNKMNKIQ